MFQLDTANHIVVSKDLVTLAIVVITLIVLYFFSAQIIALISKTFKKISKNIGVFSTTKDYQLQRFIYQHRRHPISKLYSWINEQLIALGLKRQGVTAFGYLLFWSFIAIILGTVIGWIMNLGMLTVLLWFIVLFCLLIFTRVTVSERMEKREADIMNAIDLIVPEVGNGVKNAIITYKDNFAPSLQEDFAAFVNNIQDRGFTFADAMYILTDNLGMIFVDFAQKAIYYEAIGDPNMLDIFSDITETNRLRRQLRDENTNTFASLKMSFLVSTAMTVGYFFFLMFTDDFSRYFFLQQTFGKFLLIVMLLVIFCVLAYISTIKSRAI